MGDQTEKLTHQQTHAAILSHVLEEKHQLIIQIMNLMQMDVGLQLFHLLLPWKRNEKKSSSLQPTSKFGPVHPTARQTELFCDAPFEAECSAEQPTEKPNSPIPNGPNTASFSPNTVSFSPNTVSNSPNSPNSPNTVTFSPNTVTFSPNTFSQVDG